MSARQIHTVLAGDIDAALEHGLTLKAICGLVWVPTTATLDGLAQCSECEAIQAEEAEGVERRAPENRPHYVYRHYDADGRLLYVGCTVDPKTRQLGHQQSSWWFSQSARVRLTIYPNRLHALRVERHAIRDEKPLWNVRHQDYSTWPREQLRLGRDVAHSSEAPDLVVKRFRKLAGAS